MLQPNRVKLSELRDALALGPSTARVLGEKLRVSQPTVSRLLGQLGSELVTRGRTRRTRYALRRVWRGSAESFPVYRVDETGKAHREASLDLTRPSGSACDLSKLGWPTFGPMADGWFEGLPYPLLDMRPQGFLGRNFARQHAARLAVSDNPLDWSDDDIVAVLTEAGSDLPGDLIVGANAMAAFTAQVRADLHVCADSDVPALFPDLADRAMKGSDPGSSAGGDFPKFTVARARGNRIHHSIVKFSGIGESPAVRRWADLLRCERRAANILAQGPDIPTAATTIIESGGRTFLEIERFDRHGMHGRSGACTLESLDAALIGSSESDWTRVVRRLGQVAELEPGVIERVDVLWWFGQLIANSDMHKGNLAFTPGPRLALAPAFDMLPMRYAPARSGEVPNPTFEPRLPLPEFRGSWQTACDGAIRFWDEVSADPQMDDSLRMAATTNTLTLRRLRERA